MLLRQVVMSEVERREACCSKLAAIFWLSPLAMGGTPTKTWATFASLMR